MKQYIKLYKITYIYYIRILLTIAVEIMYGIFVLCRLRSRVGKLYILKTDRDE